MPGVFWSEKEEKLLKKLWANPKVSFNDLLKIFPKRTMPAIRTKANNIGLGKKAVETSIDYKYLEKLLSVKEV